MLKLSSIFTDGAILQRGVETKVWGFADPSSLIKVEFAGETKTAQTNQLGHWLIEFDELQANSDPQLLSVSSSSGETISIKNVLIGEVWLCGGQSNMQLWMSRCAMMFPDIIDEADNEEIRFFTVPETVSFDGEQTDLTGGKWKAISPKTIPDCSAVAYFFADELQKRLKVPVGIVIAAIGGTPVEAWMNEEKIKDFPDIFAQFQKLKNEDFRSEISASDAKNNDDYYSEVSQKDLGLIENWSSPEFDDSNWADRMIDSDFSGDENSAGVFWFRKSFTVPDELVGRPAQIYLGTLVDEDFVYVNGEQIGTTGYRYPPRYYSIPALPSGKCTIALRLLNQYETPDVTESKPRFLVAQNLNGETKTLNLNCEWKFKRSCKTNRRKEMTFLSYSPTVLFNGMIAPIANFNFAGAIFYQGEANCAKPHQYSEKFAGLISAWRSLFSKTPSQFPFLFAQISYQFYTYSEDWKTLRSEQTKTLKVENTGMIFTQDIGEFNDLHPTNKMLVGNRFARLARKMKYHEEIKQTPFELTGWIEGE